MGTNGTCTPEGVSAVNGVIGTNVTMIVGTFGTNGDIGRPDGALDIDQYVLPVFLLYN